MKGKDININISTSTFVKAILLLLLVAFLFFLRDLVLVVLTAVVIASAIEPATAWFMKYRVPRVVAVLLVYIILFTFLFGLFYFFLPPLLNEAIGFLATLPHYLDLLSVYNPIDSVLGSQTQIIEKLTLAKIIASLQTSFSTVTGGFFQTVSGVFGGVLSLILIIVFSFYFAFLETGVDDFLKIITPVQHQKYVLGLWKRSQLKIGRWMQGQLMLGLIIGILVYLGLTILGVKYALLLAIIAGIFEIIPVFGPILAAIPAVALGFVDGGATLGLLVIGLYVIIQQFENHLIYPLVVTKVVGVPPLLVILALIIGAEVAGFWGIILSVPVAAVIQEFVKDVQKEKAEFLKRETQKS